jgi:hypothetical protein
MKNITNTTTNTNNKVKPILEVTDVDLEELARLIKEGYTGGRLDDESGKRITWELKLDVWEEE